MSFRIDAFPQIRPDVLSHSSHLGVHLTKTCFYEGLVEDLIDETLKSLPVNDNNVQNLQWRAQSEP